MKIKVIAGEAVTDVKVYLTERLIDGERFGEEICARSFEEAQELASRIDAKVLGERKYLACQVCGMAIIDRLHDGEKAPLVN